MMIMAVPAFRDWVESSMVATAQVTASSNSTNAQECNNDTLFSDEPVNKLEYDWSTQIDSTIFDDVQYSL